MKRARKIKDLDKYIRQKLNEADSSGITALEKIVVNLIDLAATTNNVKIAELLFNRAYGPTKQQSEVLHTHSNIPPINWAEGGQTVINFELSETEKKALGNGNE
jgi:hypothetical protein